MEDFLKITFEAKHVHNMEKSGGGCINEGCAYQVDSKQFFVKFNEKNGSDVMFEGESESLKAILETETVCAPQPVMVCKNPIKNGNIIIMEYLDMHPLSSFASRLGKELANLHMHNIDALKKSKQSSSNITSKDGTLPKEEFGFHIPTCCGFHPMDNSWSNDWVEFYSRKRLDKTINLIIEKNPDRELLELWSELQLSVHKLFKNIIVEPSLLHGDLWGGNAAETKQQPVIFDPCSYYGHHETDLAISKIFGGFGPTYFESYHSVIPKQQGFDERQHLYKLFHYLNHWNHFGSSYRLSVLNTMRTLIKVVNNIT